MTILDSLALAAADRVRKTAGPRAGVLAYRNLLSSNSGDTRARAILAGILCAIDASDEHAAYTFAEGWFGIDLGVWERDIVTTCKALDQARYERAAIVLAHNERRRKDGPFIAYTHAKLAARRGFPDDALRAYEACAAFQGLPGATKIVAAAKAEIARVKSLSADTRDEAVAIAKAIDPVNSDPPKKMQIASIMLSSKSRFERAAALSTLADLARDHEALTGPAILRAVNHADRAGKALTPLEADRVRAAISRWPNETERLRALRLLDAAIKSASTPFGDEARITSDASMEDLVVKANAVLAGALGPTMVAAPDSKLLDLAFAAIARAKRNVLASVEVDAVTHAFELAMTAPPSLHTLALLALGAKKSHVRDAGARLAEKLLASDGKPARGFLRLADALLRAEKYELAQKALERAESALEEGAGERLAVALARDGRAAHKRGDRTRALAAFDQARRRSAGR